MLNIGIIGNSDGDRFGVNNSYMEYFSQFGIPHVINPNFSLEEPYLNKDLYKFLNVLVLPGGSDLRVLNYASNVSFTINDSDQFLELGDDLITDFINLNKPIIGICRGHQALNVYFCGTLNQNLRWHPHSENSRDELVHSITLNPETSLALGYESGQFGTEWKVNSMHHQGIDKLGEGLIPLAHSDDEIIEIFTHKNLKILGFQYHPEEIWDDLSINLIRKLLNL